MSQRRRCWFLGLEVVRPRLLVLALAGLTVASAPVYAQSGGDAGEIERLQKRVEQLEGQLVDLQVVIGTLESLARAPSGSAAPSFSGPVGGGGDDGRIAALETQIRALTAQVEQMSQAGTSPAAALRPSAPAEAPSTSPSAATGFGSTTVTPGRDSIGGLITNNGFQTDSLRGGGVGRVDETPDLQYEAAYGALLQQNYPTAEAGFSQFLQDNPRHRLAGNAQYWLGEVYFVQGDYRAAANAFLNGYQNYGQSSKAPDSLLKLAMSLNRLGARDDACASLKAIAERYPDAPGHIRNRANTESRQMGCPS